MKKKKTNLKKLGRRRWGGVGEAIERRVHAAIWQEGAAGKLGQQPRQKRKIDKKTDAEERI